MRTRLGTLAAAIALVATLAATAEAGTTVGSSLRQRANLYVRCSGNCTAVQSARPGGAGITVPVDGVITRWRVRAATLGKVRFRVLRPEAGGGYTSRLAGEWVALNRTHAPGEDVLYEFPVRLPVSQGDALALDRDPKAGAIFHSYGSDSSYAVADFVPALADDAVDVRPTSVSPGRELLMNAVIENDGDGDGFGDETQDNCPTVFNDQTDRPCSTAGPESTAPTGPTSTPIATPVPHTRGTEGPPVSGERPIAKGKRRHGARRRARARPPRAKDPQRGHSRKRGARSAPRRPSRRGSERHATDPGSRPKPVSRPHPTGDHERRGARPEPPVRKSPTGDSHDDAPRRVAPRRTDEPRGRGHRRRAGRRAPQPPPPPGWQRHSR